MSAPGRVVAIAELGPEGLAPVTWEVLACTRRVAAALGLDAAALVVGQDVESLAQEMACRSGLPAWAVEVAGLHGFHGEAQRRALAQALPRLEARVVLGAHSTSGLDWAPALAAEMEAAYIPGVEGLREGGERLGFWRSAHFGKLREALAPATWPLVLTVQAGAFAADPPEEASPGAVEVLRLEALPCRTEVLALKEGAGADAGLGRAQVVVAAGRGVGKEENLGLLRRLAGLFSSASLAGSRPVCDLGWLGYGQQVGQTGATITPRLYIACGISGARQHAVGMQGSGFIVSINSDPQAAICNLADVCVVEDLSVFLPALLELAEPATAANHDPGQNG
ncbi:electron transfer flavoprotein subunit alpha/FixB family protein [Desulfoferula mesophila]|uniref:Electron transfer flavoprotein alpha/beta-subunit N-terminal domain-containing protein n=1 Tax=Desulfoferula mesophila TaxID=3058419 RepID=A0AAU9EBU8_9BACT|nr:hypothetical protein FAK_16920 [Desulfoferula mesophilus]